MATEQTEGADRSTGESSAPLLVVGAGQAGISLVIALRELGDRA
ncbi:MAG: peptidoglycan endopeptidase, partial [Dermatophilaceae bacterium]|nr:peptidoglycan endopeptidase [Dermatophilaceae bacterium]